MPKKKNTGKESGGIKISTKKSKKMSKSTRKLTTKAYNAAMKNLEKARIAKKNYQRLREEGFNLDNVYNATQVIQRMLNHGQAFNIELNPAVSQLLDEIGDFPSSSELANMSQKEFFKYATSLRVFLASPLSDPDTAQRAMDRILSNTIRGNFTRRPNEDINEFKRRRKEFISDNEDMMKDVFELYRRVEETNAGQILKNISPSAYGSENLITDLTEFVETEFDGDIEAAAAYWRGIVINRYQEALEYSRQWNGVEMEVSRYDWRRSYGAFTAQFEHNGKPRAKAKRRK